MKKGWEVKKLESVVNRFIVPQRDRPKVFDGRIPWCRIEDIDGIYLSKSKSGLCVSQEVIDSMPLRVYPKDTVIVSCSADLGRCAIIKNPLITNQTFIGLVPSKEIDSLYLYYLMGSRASQLNEMASGATIKYLSKKKFQNLEILLPPILEQKAIVSKIGQAFKAIDQAIAYIKNNITNAEELFQSKLKAIFSQTGEGWEEKKLGDVLKLKSGKNLTKKEMNNKGQYLVYGGNGFAGNHDDYNMNGDYVIIGRVGAQCGNVRFVQGKFWLTDNAFSVDKIKEDFNLEFLSILLININLRSYARQAAQPVISNSSIKDAVLSYPKEIKDQEKIVALVEKSTLIRDTIKQKYQQKLSSLEELKQSILEKAFKGELV